MERCRQIFYSRNFILSALRADSAGTCWNTTNIKVCVKIKAWGSRRHRHWYVRSRYSPKHGKEGRDMAHWPFSVRRTITWSEGCVYKVGSNLRTICPKTLINQSGKSAAAAVKATPIRKLCPLRELYGRPTWRAASLRRLMTADLVSRRPDWKEKVLRAGERWETNHA